jgi:chromatin remodeling complex protein RSC6
MAKKISPKTATSVSDSTSVKEVVKEEIVTPPVKEDNTIIETETDKYDVVLDKLQTFVNEIKDLIATVKVLKKENAKTQKLGSKRQRKTSVDAGKRPASGITKPTRLSDDLCDFLGVTRGSSLARTEVTKIINTYIKNNKLQDEADRRTIHPDAKLKKILLPIPDDKKLSFFNMQSYIKHQFIKTVV